MGFLSREHSNIDPFNAGEPVMPWDDPQTSQGAQENPIFSEGSRSSKDCSYHAPIKEQDAYEPVEHEAEHDSALASAFASAFSEDDEQVRTFETKTPTNKGANKRTTRRVTITSSKGSATPKRGPGKIFARVIAGVIAISVVASVVGIVIETVEDVISDVASDSSDYSSKYYSSSSATYSEEDEQELTDLVQQKLDTALADTAGMDARYRKVLDERLKNSLGCAAEDLGLDTDAFCTWMRERSTMEISSVFCFDDASIYLSSTYPALYELNQTFGDKAYKYLSKQDIDTYAPIMPELSEKQKQHVNELFTAALAELDQTTTGSSSFEADKEGDAWEIDEDDFDEALDQLLGYYED